MTSDDFLRRKMEEAEKFDGITRTYSEETGKIEDLELIIEYLQGVMEGYLFKRLDRPSFVTEDEGSIIRVTNGYFIVKQSILYDFRNRISKERPLFVRTVCQNCRSTDKVDIMYRAKEISALSVDSKREEDLDLTITRTDRPDLLINLSFTGKLGSIRMKRLLKRNYDILDIIINADNEYADHKYFSSAQTCKYCRIEEELQSNKRIEEITKEIASEIKTEEKKSTPEILKEELKDTDGELSEENKISNEEYYEIYDKVIEGLTSKIQRGKYVGRSFQWIIAFDFDYLRELLELHDHEDEMKYYLKNLLELGNKIGLEQFPELIELRDRLNW